MPERHAGSTTPLSDPSEEICTVPLMPEVENNQQARAATGESADIFQRTDHGLAETIPRMEASNRGCRSGCRKSVSSPLPSGMGSSSAWKAWPISPGLTGGAAKPAQLAPAVMIKRTADCPYRLMVCRVPRGKPLSGARIESIFERPNADTKHFRPWLVPWCVENPDNRVEAENCGVLGPRKV